MHRVTEACLRVKRFSIYVSIVSARHEVNSTTGSLCFWPHKDCRFTDNQHLVNMRFQLMYTVAVLLYVPPQHECSTEHKDILSWAPLWEFPLLGVSVSVAGWCVQGLLRSSVYLLGLSMSSMAARSFWRAFLFICEPRQTFTKLASCFMEYSCTKTPASQQKRHADVHIFGGKHKYTTRLLHCLTLWFLINCSISFSVR